MKTNISLMLLAGLALLGSGCVGSGPNTQQGAVAGGALGALAGAVIGNNSGGHNGVGGAIIGGIAGAAIGGTVGNQLDHQRGTLYTSETQATTDYAVDAPPVTPQPPREVVVAQPAPDMVWVGGYWIYESHGYSWVAGHWERPPPRYSAYVSPHWAHHEGRYVYVRGYWR
jgi:YXWGXW repeat-containing protein